MVTKFSLLTHSKHQNENKQLTEAEHSAIVTKLTYRQCFMIRDRNYLIRSLNMKIIAFTTLYIREYTEFFPCVYLTFWKWDETPVNRIQNVIHEASNAPAHKRKSLAQQMNLFLGFTLHIRTKYLAACRVFNYFHFHMWWSLKHWSKYLLVRRLLVR